jgi:hypothetical protein
VNVVKIVNVDEGLARPEGLRAGSAFEARRLAPLLFTAQVSAMRLYVYTSAQPVGQRLTPSGYARIPIISSAAPVRKDGNASGAARNTPYCRPPAKSEQWRQPA